MQPVSLEELQSGLAGVRLSPAQRGRVEMIVRRPGVGIREELTQGLLNSREGLTGDNWAQRRSTRTGAAPRPETQITVMNSRFIALIAQNRSRWPLAGDQLYVDLDLSEANLPVGTELEVGTAVISVSAEPHTGCGKFVERFGVEAMKLVNSPLGRELRLRGIHARVVQPGAVQRGAEVVVRRAAPE